MLVKEATLKLRLDGFAQAERAAANIAKAFQAAQQAADRLAASAGRARTPGLPATGVPSLGRVASATGGAAVARVAVGTGGVTAGAGISSSLGAIGAAAGVAAGAIYGVARAGQALFSTMGQGEKIATTSKAFDRLSQSVGGGTALMAALERATGGGVAQLNLMTAANRLLLTDLGMSRERLEKVATAVTILGKAQGVSAKDAIERMSLALAKQEPELLDELGIKVDLTKAIHEYATANKVAVESVDAQTRSRLFAEKVEQQALERSGKLAGTVSVQASATESLTKRWDDFSAKIAKLVSEQPGFVKLLEATASAAISIGTALSPLIQVFGKLAEWLAVLVEWWGKFNSAVASSPAALAAFGGPIGAALGAGQAAAQTSGFKGIGGSGAGGRGGSGGSGGGGAMELSARSASMIGQAVAAALMGRRLEPVVGANGFGG